MSSDRRRRAVALLPVALAVVALFVGALAAACGKQGDPQPRPRAIPRAATDLALVLRGGEALLTFSYPSSSMAGLPLPPLRRATVYEVARELAPNTTRLTLSPTDLEALSRPVAILEGSALTSAIVGDRIRVRVPIPAESLADGKARAWAVRTEALDGEPSPWSNVVSGLPRAPLPAPEGIEAKATAPGVELTWQPVEGAAGYAVLRRPANEPEWGAPVTTVGADARTWLDRSAVYGERYVYTVVALSGADPATESAPRLEREVDFRDVFAPAAPRGLRAVALAEEVRLVWEASPDPDLAGYVVQRSVAGGEWQPLTPAPVDELERSDRSAPAGRALAYRVVAVDRTGNVSPPSAPAEVRRR